MIDLRSPRGAKPLQLELSTEDRRSSVESSSFSLRLLLVRLGAALALLFLGLTTACTKERVEVKNLDVNPDSLYTARMLQLNTLISDSGLVRYRMTAPAHLRASRAQRVGLPQGPAAASLRCETGQPGLHQGRLSGTTYRARGVGAGRARPGAGPQGRAPQHAPPLLAARCPQALFAGHDLLLYSGA